MAKSNKNKWVRVTKEFVTTFAQQGCGNCSGKGFVGDDASGYSVCSCATLAFRREMDETGKVRRRTQRIGDHEVTWLEYRPIGSVPARDDITAPE